MKADPPDLPEPEPEPLPASLSRNAFSSASRFIGLPDFEPFFLLLPLPFLPPPTAGPPKPGMPPMALLLMRFIIFAACSNRCNSPLTAETVTPEP